MARFVVEQLLEVMCKKRFPLHGSHIAIVRQDRFSYEERLSSRQGVLSTVYLAVR